MVPDMKKSDDADLDVSRQDTLNMILKLKRGWSKYVLRRPYGSCPPDCDREDHPVGRICAGDTRTFGHWALCWDSALFLRDILMSQKPKTIVELGSGTSTLLFARYAQESKESIRAVSIENDGEFLAKTQEKLSKQGLTDRVTFLHADMRSLEALPGIDVVPDWLDRHETAWYALDHTRLDSLLPAKIDLLFVDGPPAEQASRWPAFPFFLQYLSPAGIVLLDDVRRKDEYHVFRSWLDLYRDRISDAGLIARGQGMASLRLTGMRKENL